MPENSSGRFGAVPLPVRHGSKEPLKSNIFRAMSQSNTELLPLFPYEGPGDIVPCGSAKRGGENHGYFLHLNTVDEVVLVWGARGGRGRTGFVRVGPRTHGVTGPNAEDPNEFALVCITQRQMETGSQTEAVMFQCEKCSAEVYRYDFDAQPREWGAHAGGQFYPAPATILGSATAAMNYNASEGTRRCKACGHMNTPFPLAVWGWERFVARNSISEDARGAQPGGAA
jgi:hypothetical protein